MIRNKNFICSKMSMTDVTRAFECGKKPKEYVYDTLIEEGWIRKIGDRFFAPTEKLLNEAFLPVCVSLDENQRRYLSNNTHFYRVDLLNAFGGEQTSEQIVKKLIAKGYIVLDDSKRYRKSGALEEFLADGDDTFMWND